MILWSFLLLFTGISIKLFIGTITHTYACIFSNFFLRKSYITQIINFMINKNTSNRECLVNISRGNIKVKTKEILFYFFKLFHVLPLNYYYSILAETYSEETSILYLKLFCAHILYGFIGVFKCVLKSA